MSSCVHCALGVLIALALPALGPSAAAQENISVRGAVTSEADHPLPGVAVEVIGTYWSTVTSSPAGTFHVRLPAGRWRLRFSRIGYRPDTVAVDVGDRTVELEPVGLAVRPTELKALAVESERSPAFARTVTTETVRQAPPLGEPDVFRSLVLLPGVTQPNDLSGRIHLAGGASDETGVRLDGHPLQDPFHLLGLLGAFNVAALERADVLIHRLPPDLGGRLSGIVDLRSRAPGSEAEHEAVVSLLSSSFTTVSPEAPAGLDVLASGRITYADRIGPLFVSDFPKLGYYDALLRLGRSWGEGWRAEVLGYTTQNYVRGGEVSGIAPRDNLGWGESLVGLRFLRETSDWTFGLRGSVDRSRTGLDERPTGLDRVDMTRDWWSGSAWAERRAASWKARLGLDVEHRRHDQFWDAPGQADEFLSESVPERFSRLDEQTAGSLFGELVLRPGASLSLSAGGRLLHLAGRWYAAPRLRLGYELGQRWTLEASAGRRYQADTEIEEPAEGTISPPVFLLEEPRRADVAALGAEWRGPSLPFGDGARLSLEAYVKDYDRMTYLPGRSPIHRPDVDPATFPALDRVGGRGYGFSARLVADLGEEGLVQGSYTFQRSRHRIDGRWINTDWETPHHLSLFASVPLGPGWTINGAYRMHSGHVATPVEAVTPVGPRITFGERNSVRLAPYQRLDVGVRHRWGEESRWTLFFQVLNVVNTENPIEPDYTSLLLPGAPGGQGDLPGLPIVPSVGIEVRW